MKLNDLAGLLIPRTGEQITLTVLGVLLLAVVVALVIILIKRRR